MIQATIYYKTQAGVDEVQMRHAGLNARVRQLLILVDGKRSVGELGKLMASAELEEFLSLLELKGLILARQSAADALASAPGSNRVVGGSSSVPNTSQQQAGLAISDFEESESPVALAPAARAARDTPVGMQTEAARFKVDRINMSKLLQATVGPMADDLCVRIERASSHAELGELFTAAATVVELMSGRKAAEKFVEKMKQMGWES